MDIGEMITEGDMVAARFDHASQQDGAVRVRYEQEVEVRQSISMRSSGGQIIERRGQPDFLGLFATNRCSFDVSQVKRLAVSISALGWRG